MGSVLTPLLYRRADKVVTVSHAVAVETSIIAHIPQQKIDVIYNPVIPYDFEQLTQGDPDQQWLLEHDKPVVLAIGRLVPEKDFITLIEAFAIVRSKKDARLIILGDGPERKNIEAAIARHSLQDCVELSGFRSNVFPWLRSADLLVLSSITEALSAVLIEALACGTPVVSTDCGGPAEVLENGRYGILVPLKDPQMMAEAIVKTLEARHDRDLLRQRGHYFSVDKAAVSYEKLFYD